MDEKRRSERGERAGLMEERERGSKRRLDCFYRGGKTEVTVDGITVRDKYPAQHVVRVSALVSVVSVAEREKQIVVQRTKNPQFLFTRRETGLSSPVSGLRVLLLCESASKIRLHVDFLGSNSSFPATR